MFSFDELLTDADVATINDINAQGLRIGQLFVYEKKD